MKAKKCTKCGKTKEPWEFNLDRSKSDGLRGQCRGCIKKINYENRRNRSLKLNYGITEAHFDLMLKSQNGVCAICGKPEVAKTKNGKIQSLSVDHCHKTNKIRGLLCQKCNISLGGFKDDLKLLRNATEYLEKAHGA